MRESMPITQCWYCSRLVHRSSQEGIYTTKYSTAKAVCIYTGGFLPLFISNHSLRLLFPTLAKKNQCNVSVSRYTSCIIKLIVLPLKKTKK